MKKERFRRYKSRAICCGLIAGVLLAASSAVVCAQEASSQESSVSAGGPVALTLKRAIELALQNSRDIQVAKLQASLADRSSMVTRSQFLPNSVRGIGLGLYVRNSGNSGRASARDLQRDVPGAGL